MNFMLECQERLLVRYCFATTGLEINEKIQSHFAIRSENLVAISQILVAKSPRCIVLSAVQPRQRFSKKI